MHAGGYGGAAASSSFEPKVAHVTASAIDVEPDQPPFDVDGDQRGSGGGAGSAFASRSRTGPVTNFRDGGGPEVDDLDLDESDGLPI
jgi:hypothetical protein